MAFQYYFVLGFEAIGAANRGLIWYQSVCQVSAQKKDICFPLQQPLDVQLVGFQACGTRQVLLVPRLTSFFWEWVGDPGYLVHCRLSTVQTWAEKSDGGGELASKPCVEQLSNQPSNQLQCLACSPSTNMRFDNIEERFTKLCR